MLHYGAEQWGKSWPWFGCGRAELQCYGDFFQLHPKMPQEKSEVEKDPKIAALPKGGPSRDGFVFLFKEKIKKKKRKKEKERNQMMYF